MTKGSRTTIRNMAVVGAPMAAANDIMDRMTVPPRVLTPNASPIEMPPNTSTGRAVKNL